MNNTLIRYARSFSTYFRFLLMRERKISWTTVIFAPRYYMIELVAGESFWMYDNGARIGFYAHAGGGWRTAGADAAGGLFIPDGINLTWLAPLEGKYYHLRAKIPKKEISAAFTKKISIDTKDEPNTQSFTEIQFSLAPGGFVSMRLGWAQVIEVAQFQAEEVDISWEYFARANHFNPEGLSEDKYISGLIKDLPKDIKEQKENNTIPIGRWKAFNTQKFPWYLSSQLHIYGYTEFLINGDKKFFRKSEVDFSPTFTKKAVPAWYRLYFKHEGKRYKAIIRFSQSNPDAKELPDGDVEIFNIFEKYFAENKGPVALTIDLVDEILVAYLTNGSERRKLPFHGTSYSLLEDRQYRWFK